MGGAAQPCCDGLTLLKTGADDERNNLTGGSDRLLRQPHGQFIAGHRETGHGAPFAVINPATGEAIAEITAADVGRRTAPWKAPAGV